MDVIQGIREQFGRPDAACITVGPEIKLTPSARIIKFNPESPSTVTWNLLDEIHSATDCARLARTLIALPQDDDQFFAKNARQLFEALLLALASETIPLSFPRAHSFVSLGVKRVSEFLAGRRESEPLTKEFLALIKSGSANADTIFFELGYGLQLWANDNLFKSTERTSFDWKEVLSGKRALAIELDGAENLQGRFARAAAISVLRMVEQKALAAPGGRLATPVDILIDDSLCDFEDFEDLEPQLKSLSKLNVTIMIYEPIFGERAAVTVYKDGAGRAEIAQLRTHSLIC